MKDGIYKVEFKTQIGSGAGVIVISGDSVKGGDSGMYYTGTIEEIEGNRINIKVHVQRHSHDSGITSTLGLENANLLLCGTESETTAIFSGKVAENQSVSFEAHLSILK